MKIRSVFGAMITSLFIASGLVAIAPSASAHDFDYPFGRCDQRTKLFSSDITIGENPSLPFPQNGSGGGVVNSYYNRLGETIAEWNRALRAPEGSGVTKSFRYVNRTTSADVVISYGGQDIPATAGGVTFLPSVCTTVHPTSRIQMGDTPGYSYIRMALAARDDWFTQEQSERAKWDKCGTVIYNAYSCSKYFDAGTTFTHEFGHVLGILDITPNLTDHLRASGVTNYNKPLTTAKCGNVNDVETTRNRATMCPVLPPYNTGGRVLEAYDFTSLRLNIQ